MQICMYNMQNAKRQSTPRECNQIYQHMSDGARSMDVLWMCYMLL